MKDFHSSGVKNITAGSGDAPQKLFFFFCFVGLLESFLHPQMKNRNSSGAKKIECACSFHLPIESTP